MVEVGLKGKVVAITGAAHGLGRAYARDAAAAGADVVLNDVDETGLRALSDEIEAAGSRTAVIVGGVSDRGVADALASAATERFGRLDGLVNNAGVRPEGPAWAEDPDSVRRAVEINVLGTILCGIAALRVMKGQRSGSVVNVSSRAQSGIPESATYSATKGAHASLTYSWALDLRDHGVRVNAVAPQAGGTGTRRASTTKAGEPMPEEMAPLVTYLLSDASRFVTGQVIRLGRPGGGPMQLSLMTHPRTVRSFARDDGWDADALASLFDQALGSELEPVGAAPIPVAYRIVDGAPVFVRPAEGL